MPDESSRLADDTAAATETAESTRLRDQATTRFQQRRRQFDRREEQIEARGREFADTLDLGADSVRPVQLDDRGEDIGFVPTGRGRETLVERFADDRPFVDADDAMVDANPRGNITTRTDPARADEIAADARADAAADDEFTDPSDLTAAVGPGGVEAVEFTNTGRRRRASRQLEAETPLDEVDPTADLQQADDGLTLDAQARQRSAARGFEDRIDTFEQGELTADDVRQTDSGFGLGRTRAREAAADRIDEQVGAVDVGPDDISIEETPGGGFEAGFEQEVDR